MILNWYYWCSVIVLLDWSTAFGTIDHKISMKMLQYWVSISGMAYQLECFASISDVIFFNICVRILQKNNISRHCYADDTWLYFTIHTFNKPLQPCKLSTDINEWMCVISLKLNSYKTKVLCSSSEMHQASVEPVCSCKIYL